MEPLEDRVVCFVQAHQLFRDGGRILLAVSGGADSLALLHVMQTLVSRQVLHVDLVCLHVNHQLRGADADGDEAFVVQEAANLNLPVVTQRVDVRGHARAQRLSIETAGRQLRLACLAEAARAQGCTWVATGHQQNDNAETLLQRLRRGTGFRGLAGIRPARAFGDGLRLGRPLLECTRADILAYLRVRGLCWREDQTNKDCAHRRNFIRHRLLPNLQEESFGSLTGQLADLAGAARKLQRRVEEEAAAATARHVRLDRDKRTIDAAALAALPEMVAVELLRRQLGDLGCGQRDLTQHHYQGILALTGLDGIGKAQSLPGSFSACRRRDRVILRRPTAPGETTIPTTAVQVTIPGTTDIAGYRIEARILDPIAAKAAWIRNDKGPFVEYLDLDRVGSTLVVRARRPGDRFVPLGMPREKKVGKFLTAAQVPVERREEILVFEDEEKIVWICPVRLSERAKITEQTHRVLVLNVTTLRPSQPA